MLGRDTVSTLDRSGRERHSQSYVFDPAAGFTSFPFNFTTKPLQRPLLPARRPGFGAAGTTATTRGDPPRTSSTATNTLSTRYARQRRFTDPSGAVYAADWGTSITVDDARQRLAAALTLDRLAASRGRVLTGGGGGRLRPPDHSSDERREARREKCKAKTK